MPTSNYQIDWSVDIDFANGFGKTIGTHTWTDVSSYVELGDGITVVVGRGDERSQADPNQLTLTLDNRDGRFTPEKTTSPYYPNVKIGRAIRLRGTAVDGSEQVEFVGYINEWPNSWPDATDGHAKVTITASSRLSRLGTQASLKSLPEIAILADSPTSYYVMGEPSGATQANDSSGNRADPLLLIGDSAYPAVFGNATGPATDGSTAVEFSNGFLGQWLVRQIATTSGSFSIEMSFLVPTSAANGAQIFSLSNSSTLLAVEVNSVGTITATGSTLATVTSSVAASFGDTHHLAVTISGTTWTLYLDGVSVGSGAVTSFPAATYTLAIGAIYPAGLAAFLVPTAGAVTLCHVATFGATLNGTQVASHANAELTGYAGETTSARLIRYAGYAGIASSDVSVDTGQTTVQHVDPTGKTALEMMRIMEATEGGVLFDDRGGALSFKNRESRTKATSLFTLDMAQQHVEGDYSPKLDRTTLANDVTAADVSGKYSAHVLDATSQSDYGVATSSLETASEAKDEPLFQASWALYKYKTPGIRVPSLSVNCLAQVGKSPNCATVLTANVGSKITVTNRPSQDSTTSASFFVEGYTRTIGQESCITTFNVSPSSPDDLTLIIGDATRGVIGTNPVAL